MGYKYSAYFFFSIFKIFCVWQYIVYSWSVVVFKLKTHINNNNVVFVFNNCHVFSDFFYATQRNYTNIVTRPRNYIVVFLVCSQMGCYLRKRLFWILSLSSLVRSVSPKSAFVSFCMTFCCFVHNK